jgi:nitrogen fixation protein FixH
MVLPHIKRVITTTAHVTLAHSAQRVKIHLKDVIAQKVVMIEYLVFGVVITIDLIMVHGAPQVIQNGTFIATH